MKSNPFTGVVQFMHPGDEHRVDKSGWTPWNVGDHRRKFLVSEGRYVDHGGIARSGNIVFWGEWEAPSQRVLTWPRQEGLPTHVVQPRYPGRPRLRPGLQNTDPYVFGDRFRYTLCQQIDVHGPTRMTMLQAGSMVLFGSHKAGDFLLDTVLVVSNDKVTHSRPTWEQQIGSSVSEVYRSVTLRPMYADPAITDEAEFCLYSAASLEAPVSGMFSFFPCLPCSDGKIPRFSKPTLQLDGLIKPKLTQSRKQTDASDLEINEAWRSVVEQVQAAGLYLGVQAVEPPVTTVPDAVW